MPEPIRLAELLASFSLATDLGAGVPLETSLRACAVATHLGAGLRLTGEEHSAVYYTALVRHLGCTAWSHEAAGLLRGDDHALIRMFEGVDASRLTELLSRAWSSPLGIHAAVRLFTHPRSQTQLAAAQCAQAEALAAELGLAPAVGTALAQIFERYDGRGFPAGLRAAEVGLVTGVAQAGHLIEVLHRTGGRAAALDELSRRRGTELAPEICDLAKGSAEALWVLLESGALVERVLEREPEPWLTIPPDQPEQLRRVALAFAHFVDLKSPYMLGHSVAVAGAAEAAARRDHWPEDQVEQLKLAALLHDLGAVSVANGVWDRAGPLGTADWEQVRLHAYHTERILSRARATRPLAAIAGGHHERLDGTGYHRAHRSEELGRSVRLLAAADVFIALGELRPHRPACTAEERARHLTAEVDAGRLCKSSVALLLEDATCNAPATTATPAAPPCGLTEREVVVLSWLARGLQNKEIAVKLGIAVRTVKHHVEHIYAKTGVSGRAAAALFAVRHGLVIASGS